MSLLTDAFEGLAVLWDMYLGSMSGPWARALGDWLDNQKDLTPEQCETLFATAAALETALEENLFWPEKKSVEAVAEYLLSRFEDGELVADKIARRRRKIRDAVLPFLRFYFPDKGPETIARSVEFFARRHGNGKTRTEARA